MGTLTYEATRKKRLLRTDLSKGELDLVTPLCVTLAPYCVVSYGNSVKYLVKPISQNVETFFRKI
jgi:hypothetical protein